MEKILLNYFFDDLSKAFLANAAKCTASGEVYKKGDFFKLNMPLTSIYIVNDPDVLKHVLIDNEPKYEKSRIYWKELRRVIGKAMGSVEGDEWTVLKQIQKSFFTKSQVERYLEDVRNISNEGVFALPDDQKINLLAELSAINFRIILKTIFGIKTTEGKIHTLVKIIEDGEAFIYWRSKYPWRPFFSFFTKNWFQTQKSLRIFTDWVKTLLDHKYYEKNSLTDILLEKGYSYNHIRNEMIIHLGASTETVAVAECWTVYLLTQHASWYVKVKQEISAHYNEGNFDPALFPVLTACVKEAMRLYPPSHAIVRDCVCEQGDTIAGQKIKKGDVMYISAYGIHRNPNFWQEPDRFNPERFLHNNEKNIETNTYLPFGAGKHACIGKYLAMPMVITTLVHLLNRYTITFDDTVPKEPVSLSTLKSKNGFFVNLIKNQQI